MAPQKKIARYKISVLGDGGVGKTALVLQSFIEEYDPTIEDSYRKQCVVDNEACTLEILDTAGQEEYTALRDQWIRCAFPLLALPIVVCSPLTRSDGDGYLILYSICSRATFECADRIIERIQRIKDDAFPANPRPFGSPYGRPRLPIVLVGNKRDQFALREVSTEEGQRLARRRGCEFFEASAKTNTNVDPAFRSCVRGVRASQRAPDGAAAWWKKDKKCVVQ